MDKQGMLIERSATSTERRLLPLQEKSVQEAGNLLKKIVSALEYPVDRSTSRGLNPGQPLLVPFSLFGLGAEKNGFRIRPQTINRRYKMKTISVDERLISHAVKKFGIVPQMLQTMEECEKLVSAINQYIRGRKNKYELAEEVADVEIMCAQMRHIIGDDAVAIEKKKKLSRLCEILERCEEDE